MRYFLLPFRYLYVIYALLTFVVLMLIVLPFAVAGSFFGKIRGGNFIFRLCGVWGDLWFFFIGIRHRNLFEVPHDKKKHYIFVANHISYLDAPIIVKTMRQPIRVLGKIEMSKIPLFGFIYRNAIVPVDRSNPENRAKSVRILKSVVNKGISIFLFPEGTFNLTTEPVKDFFDGAFRIAIESQIPLKPVLFLDGYSRMHYKSLFSLNPGRSRSVFLDEITVEGLSMNDVEMLKQRVFDIMEKKLRDYKVAWIN